MLTHFRILSVCFLSALFVSSAAHAQDIVFETSRAIAADTLTRTKLELRTIGAERIQLGADLRKELKRIRASVTRANRSLASQITRAQRTFITDGGNFGYRSLGQQASVALASYYAQIAEAAINAASAHASQFGAPAAAETLKIMENAPDHFRTELIDFDSPIFSQSNELFPSISLEELSPDELNHRAALAREALLRMSIALTERAFMYNTRVATTLGALSQSLEGADQSSAQSLIATVRTNLLAELESLGVQLEFRRTSITSLSALFLDARQSGQSALARDLERNLRNEEYLQQQEYARRDALFVVSNIVNDLSSAAARSDVPAAALSGLVDAASQTLSIQASALNALAISLQNFGQGAQGRLTNAHSAILRAEFGRVREVFRRLRRQLLPLQTTELRLLDQHVALSRARFEIGLAEGMSALQTAQNTFLAAINRIRATATSFANDLTGIERSFIEAETALRNAVAAQETHVSTLSTFNSRAVSIESAIIAGEQRFGSSATSLVLNRVFNLLVLPTRFSVVEVSALRAALNPIITQATVRGAIINRNLVREDLLARCDNSTCRNSMRRRAVPMLRVRRGILRSLPRKALQLMNEVTGYSIAATTDDLRQRLGDLRQQYPSA